MSRVDPTAPTAHASRRRRATWRQEAIFAALLIIPLVMPSDWSQDVPKRYGKRHAGLTHSTLYPPIPSANEAE